MRNTEINTEPGDGLTGYTMFLVKWSTYRDMKTNFQVIDMAPRQECLHLGLRRLLQKYVSNIEQLVCNGLCLWL